jgi:hypothetical protein
VIALFDLNEKSVTIARAGQNWPLYYSADTRIIRELKPKGMGIGRINPRLQGSVNTDELQDDATMVAIKVS